MGFKAYLILLSILPALIHFSDGCQMDSVSWLVPQSINILDVHRGEIFGSETSSITGINNHIVGQVLNGGPYFDFVYSNSRFSITTNDAFVNYEEYETETSITVTVIFNCDGGTTRQLVFIIDITDTNNNDPIIRPSTDLEITVVPPLPPGFEITGCLSDIFARDIDLTTQRVDFEIFDSTYFSIVYDEESSTVVKEFKASLRTTSLIRTIPEPIEFRISATDVDLTGDPPRTTYATVRIISDGEFELPEEPIFSRPFYLATYTEDHQVVLEEPLSLRQGYHEDVQFSLEQEYLDYFVLMRDENQISISVVNPLPQELLTQQQILLIVNAERNYTSGASATVVLQLPEEVALIFQQPSYEGSIVDNILQLNELVLAQGYTGVSVTIDIISEHETYFSSTILLNTITLTMIPLPSNVIEQNNFLNLQIVASNNRTSASTIVTLEIVKDDVVTPVFQHNLYEATYNPDDGLILDQIVMVQGHDDSVQVTLQGEHSALFGLIIDGPNFNLNASILPTELYREGVLLLTLEATKPRTVGANTAISITLPADNSSGSVFERVLYEGIIQNGVVSHATISISNFEGTNINLVGEYASLFRATVSNGIAVVEAVSPLTLPTDTRTVVLELRAGNAGAVLVLEVSATEGPELPTVSFESTSYVLRAEIGQTGLVGRVQASSDNGEAVTYSLTVNDEHLRARISINNAGDLLLSASANSGVYSFQVVATTQFTQVSGSATVYLSVVAVTECNNETVTTPLIVLDRDEEEPLRDLVLLDISEHPGCRYTMTNRWPVNQNWLYVDETGLHATAIDREDPSIAFMALSQVQVELILTCDEDVTRTKRSTDPRLDWLGPYDYGTSTWLLGETIEFDPRRSVVNLIVNDINDNIPIFIGKENEPIVVGYPISELEETVMPRSLVELQATDADIGLNAALVYWSSEPELAVSPNTGFVHVRNDQQLEHETILTVNATDLNGQGHTGSISLMVKLLDNTNIAVITVRGAFLEDESNILGNISNVLGYEVRSLRSVVVSETLEDPSSRRKRDTTGLQGASLEIYVYGLIQREPVDVDRLTTDINNAAAVTVNIANIQSLQDHLEGRLICDDPGRDTGLLVATIVLAILLFILIAAIIVWFVLKRLKKRNYEEFSDENSTTSLGRNESPGQPAKPLDVPVAKPRLNIEELKRSERRLQDMLNAPVDNKDPAPSTANNASAPVVVPLPEPLSPIVIQDKLNDTLDESDDDEFGERKQPRRKSMVTFNENVEKIIHVNDEPDTLPDPTYEVFKL